MNLTANGQTCLPACLPIGMAGRSYFQFFNFLLLDLWLFFQALAPIVPADNQSAGDKN